MAACPGRWLLFALLSFSQTTAASPNGSETRLIYADVQRVLSAHCITCHRTGDIAPMPLSTYHEVRPWARAIRQAVLLRVMPPWGAQPNPQHPFRNDRSLSQRDIDTIVKWVDQGAAEGPRSASPSAPPVASEAVNRDKPDIILRVPGFAVPATGALPYSFLILPLHLSRDTWIRAAEFHIDQRQVIHHINAFVRPPGSSFLREFPAEKIFVPTIAERAQRREGEKVFNRRELLLGYEPGYRPQPWLEDGGKLIRAGSDVVFELHYNPNGKPTLDHSELWLYFAPAPPAQRVLAIDTLRDLDLEIPAGNASYLSRASMTLARPVRVLSVQPHMHYRGKSMHVRALLLDGVSQDLVNVPKYDFNWQTTYTFREPVALPAGTTLESVAVFDNSAANKFNPNPAATVHWGDQTTDEMHIAFLELVIQAGTDPETIFAKPPRLLGQPATR